MPSNELSRHNSQPESWRQIGMGMDGTARTTNSGDFGKIWASEHERSPAAPRKEAPVGWCDGYVIKQENELKTRKRTGKMSIS